MKTPPRCARGLLPFGPLVRALALSWTVGALGVGACGHAPGGAVGKKVVQGPPPVRSAAPPAEPLAPFDLPDQELCALPLVRASTAPPSAAPFSSLEVHCPENGDPFCDTVDRSPEPQNLCFVANDNLRRAERELRAGGGKGSPAPRDPWTGTTKPRFLDRVDAHLHLTPGEHAKLRENGFVVLDRVAYDTYAGAFHDIFQEQLPLYVGIDPVLHAVFRGTELVLERVEKKRLLPALDAMLTKLRAGLLASRGRYDAETLADLDVYLGVARELARSESDDPDQPGEDLGSRPLRAPGGGSSFSGSDLPSGGSEGPGRRRRREPASLFGHDAAVRELASAGRLEHGGLKAVELFGRTRMIDFSQLTPRGHYATRDPADFGGRMRRYFRALMWLSRLEFNLVSRSSKSSHPGAVPDPAETPREARAALALAELVERSGALTELAAFEEIYTSFAGRREDVTVPDLLRLMREGHFSPREPDAPERLRAAVGEGFRRKARVHFMPQHSPELPAIATLFGPRIVPDVAPLTRLVHDAIPGRTGLGAADVGVVLGHERARGLLRAELAAHPGLDGALRAAQGELRGAAAGRDDVYAGWLRSLLAIAAPPRGVVPSFMRRDAYADARLNSALVGYGQLRHAFVLLAGQGYDSGGCEIPDAYVEPLPEVYDALLAHVRTMRAKVGGFARLEAVLSALRSAVATEVSGAALSEAQRRWLGMVAEHRPVGGYADSGEPPKWTGWYFDMFEDREIGASTSADFVADYVTLTNDDKVMYLGAEGPRLGVFVVDVNGEPRALVGPVAKGYEAESSLQGERLDDQKAARHAPKRAPWRDRYAVPAPPEPALGLAARVARCPGENGAGSEWRVVVRAERALGPVSVALLDHHADPIAPPLTLEAGAGLTAFAFELPEAFAKAKFGIEALHLRVADLQRAGAGRGAYDFFTSPSVFSGSGMAAVTEGLPLRPRGAGDFVIDGDETTPPMVPQSRSPRGPPSSPIADPPGL